MAAHHLAITRASLSASLLRPDPVPVPKAVIAELHNLLSAALTRCTPQNVQACKSWLLEHIFGSLSRIAVLAKFLVALSSATKEDETRPSAKRRRLHLLYVLHDTLSHIRRFPEKRGSIEYETIIETLQGYLLELLVLALSFPLTPKHTAKLHDLLDIWEAQGICNANQLEKFRSAVSNPSDALSVAKDGPSSEVSGIGKKSKRQEAPYLLPASHGEPGTPWHDLPAASMMPYISPSDFGPIPARLMLPMKFNSGPADPSLVMAVKDFLDEVNEMFGQPPSSIETLDAIAEKHTTVSDVDPMGVATTKNFKTGEFKEGASYYGWSREFCEQMNLKRKGPGQSAQSTQKLRRRSLSSSQSLSPRPLRHGGRAQSDSRSRSPRPTFRRRSSQPQNPHSRSRSSSRSRSRSRPKYRSSPPRPSGQLPSPAIQRPRPEFHAIASNSPTSVQSPFTVTPLPPRPFPPQQQSMPLPPPPFLLGPNGVPIPPPPPQGYAGPWPPPPPPPPQFQGGQFPFWPAGYGQPGGISQSKREPTRDPRLRRGG
ncbi:MAG: hypothetical protein M1814_001706 [Vezdaea aestivalis]|nr:MAG: hypothetical protein M1814_001706 [Vezdaea aestivalis]